MNLTKYVIYIDILITYEQQMESEILIQGSPDCSINLPDYQERSELPAEHLSLPSWYQLLNVITKLTFL